jgi:hypothetical protein
VGRLHNLGLDVGLVLWGDKVVDVDLQSGDAQVGALSLPVPVSISPIPSSPHSTTPAAA